MKAMENKLIEDLKKYFDETPREVVLDNWEKSKEWDKVGPPADVLLKSNMTLRDILIKHIPSKEIKQRLNNKQIKLNNEVVTNTNIELNVENNFTDLGDFLLSSELPFVAKIFDIKDFFGPGETNVKSLQFLKNYTLITISKREHFVYKNLKNEIH